MFISMPMCISREGLDPKMFPGNAHMLFLDAPCEMYHFWIQPTTLDYVWTQPSIISESQSGNIWPSAKQCLVLGYRFGGATHHRVVIPVVIPQFHNDEYKEYTHKCKYCQNTYEYK